jgi:hypothetical protein
MMVWLNVTVIRLTSLLLDTKNGLAVRERWEVRVPNWGAFSAPTVRSALHRVANPCVA